MSKSIKFAVILSGCGVYDGTEIIEAVLTLLAIEKNNCTFNVLAPDIEQMHVVNHLTGQEMNEKRNVLVEAARIARSDIRSLENFNPDDYDALILPGGYGAGKNLSDYEIKGIDFKINEWVENSIQQMHNQRKPIGALCISPVILAKIFGDIQLTIGKDEETISHIQKLGALHIKTNSGNIATDKKNKIVSAPCFMLNAGITDIEKETDQVVKALIEMS